MTWMEMDTTRMITEVIVFILEEMMAVDRPVKQKVSISNFPMMISLNSTTHLSSTTRIKVTRCRTRQHPPSSFNRQAFSAPCQTSRTVKSTCRRTPNWRKSAPYKTRQGPNSCASSKTCQPTRRARPTTSSRDSKVTGRSELSRY